MQLFIVLYQKKMQEIVNNAKGGIGIMNFIKLTSLDGSEQFVSCNKILNIGTTKVYYNSLNNTTLTSIETIKSEILSKVNHKIDKLKHKIKDEKYHFEFEERRLKVSIEHCEFGIRMKCPDYKYDIKKVKQLKEELKNLEDNFKKLMDNLSRLRQERDKIEQGLPLGDEYPDLKRAWDELAKWREVECTYIDLHTDRTTYRIHVKETSQDIFKMLSGESLNEEENKTSTEEDCKQVKKDYFEDIDCQTTECKKMLDE